MFWNTRTWKSQQVASKPALSRRGSWPEGKVLVCLISQTFYCIPAREKPHQTANTGGKRRSGWRKRVSRRKKMGKRKEEEKEEVEITIINWRA